MGRLAAHTYSRIQALFSDFCSISDADEVIVTRCFNPRTKADFSAKQVWMPCPGRLNFMWFIRCKQLSFYYLHPGDVLLVLSAGDANEIQHPGAESLKEANHGR